MPPLLQPGDPLDEDFDAKATRAQYELLSNALERFRKRWHSEYLLSLREKHNNVCAEDPTHHLSVGQFRGAVGTGDGGDMSPPDFY